MKFFVHPITFITLLTPVIVHAQECRPTQQNDLLSTARFIYADQREYLALVEQLGTLANNPDSRHTATYLAHVAWNKTSYDLFGKTLFKCWAPYIRTIRDLESGLNKSDLDILRSLNHVYINPDISDPNGSKRGLIALIDNSYWYTTSTTTKKRRIFEKAIRTRINQRRVYKELCDAERCKQEAAEKKRKDEHDNNIKNAVDCQKKKLDAIASKS